MMKQTTAAVVPQSTNYRLHIDVYHLTNCDDLLQKKIWVVAQIGPKQTDKIYATLKGKRRMEFKQIAIPTLEVDLPKDQS